MSGGEVGVMSFGNMICMKEDFLMEFDSTVIVDVCLDIFNMPV